MVWIGKKAKNGPVWHKGKKAKNGPKWQKIVSYSVFQEPYTGIEITDFQAPDKISNTIKYLADILSIHWTSYFGSQVETSPTCLPAKMYDGNFWRA